MKGIRTISRVFVGLVFIFSGFVKGVDPIGFGYKFHDYFRAFKLDFLQGLGLPLAVAVCTAEFLIGVSLLLGIRMRIASIALLCFMLFFTVLTFILALFNPVSDCGCFGDALKLTNWQTFLKNVVLMVFTLVIFFSRKQYKPYLIPAGEWAMVMVFFIGFGMLVNDCLRHNPIVDFRPYKPGTDMVKNMQLPPNAPRDSFATHLFYKRNDVVKEFNLANMPWKDSTWKWVETKVVKIKEGYKPPIHDFSVKGFSGNDITDSLLADKGYSFLLITPSLKKSDLQAFDWLNRVASAASRWNCRFYGLTASTQAESDSMKQQHQLAFDFYNTDETTLKTINRANPGLMLLKGGIVMAQWHYNDLRGKTITNGSLEQFVSALKKERTERLLLKLAVFLFFAGAVTFRVLQVYSLRE